MAGDATAAAVSQDVTDYLARRVRDAYPHLKTESLADLAQKNAELIITTLEVEQSNMSISKFRINLLSLPAEIRNTIYEMALDLDSHKQLRLTSRRLETVSRPSLFAVSRQIRAETLSIFWSATTIAIQVVVSCRYPYYIPVFHINDCVKEYLEGIGTIQIGLVRKVKLMLTCDRAGGDFEKWRQWILETVELDKFGFDMKKVEVQIEEAQHSGRELDKKYKKWRVWPTGWA